nr:MAG TPA: hypothetical protein [Caudoviricetes sp.]
MTVCNSNQCPKYLLPLTVTYADRFHITKLLPTKSFKEYFQSL